MKLLSNNLLLKIHRTSIEAAESGYNISALDNVALNKPAWLSSQSGTRHPWRAVDGRVLEPDDNHCVTTLQETSPWWKVHLGAEYKIRHVVISTSGE